MDVEVYWEGRLVGWLLSSHLDQPFFVGEWRAAGDAEWVRTYAGLQAQLGEGGVAMIGVTIRSPIGKEAPAAAMVRPAPEREPYFRFASQVLPARVIVAGKRSDG